MAYEVLSDFIAPSYSGVSEFNIKKLNYYYDISRGLESNNDDLYSMHIISNTIDNIWIVVKSNSMNIRTFATPMNNTSITSKANAWSNRNTLTYSSTLEGLI